MGFTPASEDEFAPYAEELNTFIAPANIPDSIIPKFQSMSTVEVSEDSGTYTCTIKDVADCAEEMKVSEEMFGYILGALHDSGAKIEFSGHSCVVEYKDFRAGSSDN